MTPKTTFDSLAESSAVVGRALHVYQDEGGMIVIRGRMAPEVGAVLVRRWTRLARRCLSGRARRPATP